MKRILKFVVVFSIIFTPINVCANSTDEYLTADLLENSQPNEIVLNTKNNTKNKKQKIIGNGKRGRFSFPIFGKKGQSSFLVPN